MTKRPGWDEYFMKQTALVAERSTCIRHHVGALFVRDKRVLVTGYNGANSNTKDCLELGCLRDELGIPSGEKHEICRAVHAEQNGIIQAARDGISIKNSKVYCTLPPCSICAKMLGNLDIEEFITYGQYPDEIAKEYLKNTDIKLRFIKKPSEIITFKD